MHFSADTRSDQTSFDIKAPSFLWFSCRRSCFCQSEFSSRSLCRHSPFLLVRPFTKSQLPLEKDPRTPSSTSLLGLRRYPASTRSSLHVMQSQTNAALVCRPMQRQPCNTESAQHNRLQETHVRCWSILLRWVLSFVLPAWHDSPKANCSTRPFLRIFAQTRSADCRA